MELFNLMKSKFRICLSCKYVYQISDFHYKMLNKGIISMLFCPVCYSPHLKKISVNEYYDLKGEKLK